MDLQSSTKEGPRVYGFWAFVVQSLKYAPIGIQIFWKNDITEILLKVALNTITLTPRTWTK
jgi:hypothetical protein